VAYRCNRTTSDGSVHWSVTSVATTTSPTQGQVWRADGSDAGNGTVNTLLAACRSAKDLGIATLHSRGERQGRPDMSHFTNRNRHVCGSIPWRPRP
jgi:hypothetical protein